MKLPDSLPFPLIRLYNPTTIFRTLDFSKLPIFQTNSASFPENLHSVSRTLTIQKPTKTGFSHLHYWNSIQQVAGRRFQGSSVYYKASEKSVIYVSKKLHRPFYPLSRVSSSILEKSFRLKRSKSLATVIVAK